MLKIMQPNTLLTSPPFKFIQRVSDGIESVAFNWINSIIKYVEELIPERIIESI